MPALSARLVDSAGQAATMQNLLALAERTDEGTRLAAELIEQHGSFSKLLASYEQGAAALNISVARWFLGNTRTIASANGRTPTSIETERLDFNGRIGARMRADGERKLDEIRAQLEHTASGIAVTVRRLGRLVPGAQLTAIDALATVEADNVSTVVRAAADLAKLGANAALDGRTADELAAFVRGQDLARVSVMAYRTAAAVVIAAGKLRAKLLPTPADLAAAEALDGFGKRLVGLAEAAANGDTARVLSTGPVLAEQIRNPPTTTSVPSGAPASPYSQPRADDAKPAAPPVPVSGTLAESAGRYLVAAALPTSMVGSLLAAAPETWPSIAARFHGHSGSRIEAAGPGRGDLLSFAAGPLSIEAAASDGLPRFSMVAYTGNAMQLGGWKHPVVVDLSGMRIPSQRIPIRLNHDSAHGVGHTEKVGVAAGQLKASGVISRDTDAAREVATAGKRGFPWQASIGASSEEVEFCKEGQNIAANGQTFPGPVTVVRRCTLGEISFVDLGADGRTSASVA
jgi:hypothetical protein